MRRSKKCMFRKLLAWSSMLVIWSATFSPIVRAGFFGPLSGIQDLIVYLRYLVMEQDMRHTFEAFNAMTKANMDAIAAAIPRPPVVGPRFSSNAFGATYEVPFGKYSGNGLVGILEVVRDDNVPVTLQITTGQQGYRQLSGGWNFEPGGLLKETYSLVSAMVSGGPTTVTQCKVVDRFQYVTQDNALEFTNQGDEQTCDFSLTGSSPNACASSAPGFCNASRATKYWSTNGQVLLDFSTTTTPVLRQPNGDSEVFKAQGSNGYRPFNDGLIDPGGATVQINNIWFTDKRVTDNGYITQFNYDTNGWVQSVTDPKGRVTQYTRDGSGRVLTIKAPGVGGGLLEWDMTYSSFTWNPSVIFDDIQCLGAGTVFPCTNSLSYTTLTSLRIPDGRTYAFTYSPSAGAPPGWGNLYSVTTPEGAATVFDYGNRNTTWISAPRLGSVPNFTGNLDKRHLASTTVYPQGLGTTGFTTRMDFDQTQTLSGGGDCSQLEWIKRTYPNGDFMRIAQCGNSFFSFPSLGTQTYAQELYSSSNNLLEGTYYGNVGGLGDTGTPVGNMYVEREAIGGALAVDLDVRPTKIIHVKDGVRWRENFDYELGDIPITPRCSGCNSFRTTGNVSSARIRDGSGTTVSTTTNTYYHSLHPLYRNRNLLRPLATITLADRDGTILTRTEYEYDEYTQFPLLASNAPNLDTSIGARRANETTVRRYKDAQNATGAVVSHKSYYDTGDVREIYDPNNNPPTVIGYDFNVCSSSKLTLTGTSTNSKGHITTTVSDCNTGLVVQLRDPNDQSTYNQYDQLGRIVEMA
jgi:YD repeat-containing protein